METIDTGLLHDEPSIRTSSLNNLLHAKLLLDSQLTDLSKINHSAMAPLITIFMGLKFEAIKKSAGF